MQRIALEQPRHLLFDASAIKQPRRLLVGQPLYWSWAPDGSTLAVHVGGAASSGPDAWIGLLHIGQGDAREERFADAPGDFRAPAWSPSGAKLAYAGLSGASLLTVRDVSGQVTHLASSTSDFAFTWSPSGDWLAFAAGDPGRPGLYQGLEVAHPAGSEHHRLSQDPVAAFYWSPDATRLAVLGIDTGARALTWSVVTVDGKDTPRTERLPAIERLRLPVAVLRSVRASALSIPPFSNPIHRILEPHWATLLELDEEELQRRVLRKVLPAEIDLEEGMRAIRERTADCKGITDLLAEEHGALIAPPALVGLRTPPPDFQTRASRCRWALSVTSSSCAWWSDSVRSDLSGASPALIRATSKLRRQDISRLSAVKTPTGYRRSRRGVRASSSNSTPGELECWEARADVRARVEPLIGAYVEWRARRKLPPDAPPTARKVLLHSFAHLSVAS